MTLLNECFSNHLISRFGNIPSLVTFLWGYFKSRVYVTNPTSLQELKNNIYSEIRQLSPDTLKNVIETTMKRSLSSQNNHGRHLNDILFKT